LCGWLEELTLFSLPKKQNKKGTTVMTRIQPWHYDPILHEIIEKMSEKDKEVPEEAKRSPSTKRGEIPVDEKLFFCEACDEVWEYVALSKAHGTGELMYYGTDFPSIGKSRKICPPCERDKIREEQ